MQNHTLVTGVVGKTQSSSGPTLVKHTHSRADKNEHFLQAFAGPKEEIGRWAELHSFFPQTHQWGNLLFLPWEEGSEWGVETC